VCCGKAAGKEERMDGRRFTSARSFDVKEMKNIKIYFASMHAGFSDRRGAWKLLRSAREEVTFAILIPYSFLKRFSSWCARVCASAYFIATFPAPAASGKLFPERTRVSRFLLLLHGVPGAAFCYVFIG